MKLHFFDNIPTERLESSRNKYCLLEVKLNMSFYQGSSWRLFYLTDYIAKSIKRYTFKYDHYFISISYCLIIKSCIVFYFILHYYIFYFILVLRLSVDVYSRNSYTCFLNNHTLTKTIPRNY